jgi:hypothetical protein
MNDGGFMAMSPLNSDIIFCTGNVYNSGYFLGVSHSSDGGTTWKHDTIGLGSRGWAVAFDGVDTNRVYVGGDSANNYPCLLISTDLGTTWTMSRDGLSGAVNVLATVPGVPDLVYAGTNTGLFISTDAGVTWEATSVPGPVRALVCDPTDEEYIFAGTYGLGVYASDDAGTNCWAMNDGLASNKVLSLALRTGAENTIYAGTEGGSVFKTTVPTGVAGSSPTAIRRSPIAISPNPCRGLTTVRFSCSLLSPRSSLSIYDASGRLVRSLAVRTPSLALRTSDLSPGVYFASLKSGRETHTVRLAVLN